MAAPERRLKIVLSNRFNTSPRIPNAVFTWSLVADSALEKT
jgi:hypothetical protein